MDVRAAFYERFGAATDVLQVGEKKLAEPAQGEVQVEVRASGVNPSDVKKRTGLRGDFTHDFVIPHSDGAGVITAVGEGVPEKRIGQRVWLYEAQHKRAWGTAAKYLNLPENRAVPLPDRASFSEGAAIGIPMMTAHRCLTSYGSSEGKAVLVTGGQGRVGYYAVQLAKLFGADVVSTVSSDEGVREVLELGADAVVNYKDENHPKQIEELRPDGVDLVVDVEFGGNFKTYLPLLKDNSVIASYASHNPTPELPFYELMFKNIFLHPILVYSMPEAAKEAAVRDINRSLEQGQISHRIAEMPLENIVKAHQAVEGSSLRGSVIVKL